MKVDKPFLLVVVDGPSEARDSTAGASSGGVVRSIIRQAFGELVEKNIEVIYWHRVKLSGLRRVRGNIEKASVIARDANESTAYGAVLLLDADGDGDTRFAELAEGAALSGVRERTAIGIAREMIEAWLLADPNLLAEPLPPGKRCEHLWGRKDDIHSNYPKHVLRRCVLEPKRLNHAQAVELFDPNRARPHAVSLDAFMREVENLASHNWVL